MKVSTFNMHLTNGCNYRCGYCFGKFPHCGEIGFGAACRVVDGIAGYFEKNNIRDGRINLAGGEPLLYERIDDLIDHIASRGVKCSIVTNGSLLTTERIRRWDGRMEWIGLSVDSVNPATNAAIGRLGPGFEPMPLDRLMALVGAIHGTSIKLKINTVVSGFNLGEGEEMERFYEEAEPDKVKLFKVEFVDGINDGARNCGITEEEFEKFCGEIRYPRLVIEGEGDMENSYVMINPAGELQMNDGGRYATYGSCLEEDLGVIMRRVPFDRSRFDRRYDAPRDRDGGAA